MTSFRTERLLARLAAPGDEEAVQAVLDGAPGYHELVDGAPADPRAGADLLADADADADRRLLLLWPGAGGAAVGLLDLQLHWPEPGAAHVRLLLLRESLHGRGLGREAAHGLEVALRSDGFQALRLSVTGENTGARAFWERIGFAPVERLAAGDTLHEKIL
ncbi:MAG: GNAT family N-acetyltransferase [Anaeromyxobacteraceae bacterium]